MDRASESTPSSENAKIEHARAVLTGFVRTIYVHYTSFKEYDREKNAFEQSQWIKLKTRDLLQLMLPLNRANALYYMKHERFKPVPRGINWYARGQTPPHSQTTTYTVFHAKTSPSIGNSILGLIEACALGDDFADDLRPYYFPDAHLTGDGCPYTNDDSLNIIPNDRF